MRLIQQLLCTLGLTFVAMGAAASPAQPVEGKDYVTLAQPQSTDSGKKVEVLEFFWYACPHCYALESDLEDWVKKKGDAISFKRVPVVFRDSFVPQQKLYYTLEAMNRLDDMHGKVFHAIHVGRNPLDTDKRVIDFVTSQGMDRQKFLDTYNSFSVMSKVQQAKKLQSAYQVDGVPLIAVGGRYKTSPAMVSKSIGNQSPAALHAATLQVMDNLIQKAATGGK
jgi:thiol:disulfide interchange protein DsbA